MNDNILFQVGIFKDEYNKHLDFSLPLLRIMQSKGLAIHIRKRHPNYEKYLSDIPLILNTPDYIGNNPKELDSIELIKVYDENIQLAIKLDKINGYYYIASIYDITTAKIDKRLANGRLKKYLTN